MVVVGPSRSLPAAKDSFWAWERMPLEQHKDRAEAAEALLCTTSGRVQEGLVSNLFVVVCDGGESALHVRSPPAPCHSQPDLARGGLSL